MRSCSVATYTCWQQQQQQQQHTHGRQDTRVSSQHTHECGFAAASCHPQPHCCVCNDVLRPRASRTHQCAIASRPHKPHQAPRKPLACPRQRQWQAPRTTTAAAAAAAAAAVTVTAAAAVTAGSAGQRLIGSPRWRIHARVARECCCNCHTAVQQLLQLALSLALCSLGRGVQRVCACGTRCMCSSHCNGRRWPVVTVATCRTMEASTTAAPITERAHQRARQSAESSSAAWASRP
jgi:hypothetical protein